MYSANAAAAQTLQPFKMAQPQFLYSHDSASSLGSGRRKQERHLRSRIPKRETHRLWNSGSTPVLSVNSSSSLNEGASSEDFPTPQSQQSAGFWAKWKAYSAEMSGKLAKLGLAAVLAYGLFDGVTYTTFFVLAFLGYEKSTGKNPAANLQALLGIVILMWTGNNVTRPFRVAGAAALAPVIDKGLRKIQKYFNFPTLVYAFALVVSIVASLCLTVVGMLILSRWGR